MKPAILVIEDESAIADTIVFALQTEGFETRWCATGGEGLASLEGAPVALVVLDVGLPDYNGFDLCREIRARFPVPVIFLTARSGEVDRVVGLEIGADDYVVKPFSPRELAARVKAVLRRAGSSHGPSPPPPGALPFAVDENKCAIAYRGRPLELSRYEYRILKTLLGHPGWVYTRAQLMEIGWDEPDESFERTVDSHVKNLRAKLKAVDPSCDPIRTHRGQGYSLKEER